MKTIIIGKRSNLSKKLFNVLDNCILVPTSDIENNISSLIQLVGNDEINLVLNNFQTSTHLYDNTNFVDYINKAILNTAKVLKFLIENNIIIKKLIYTSSSSVYGNNKFCSESDDGTPLAL